MLVEVDPELLGALPDLVAVDAGGERRLLELLRTDFGVIPWMPVGRTSAQAAMKPDSSSTAKSVFAICVSRGTSRNVA